MAAGKRATRKLDPDKELMLRHHAHVSTIRTEWWTILTLLLTLYGLSGACAPDVERWRGYLVEQWRAWTQGEQRALEGVAVVVSDEGGRRVVRLYAVDRERSVASLIRGGLSRTAVEVRPSGEIRFAPGGAEEWKRLRALVAKVTPPRQRVQVARRRPPYAEITLQ
ncbi:MAG: hypothetical protein FJX76_01280 [Armatimonadetes bacterium]|nr:hypothetical protein [Armatimonadota bacterium]